jgi:hypothetical protein
LTGFSLTGSSSVQIVSFRLIGEFAKIHKRVALANTGLNDLVDCVLRIERGLEKAQPSRFWSYRMSIENLERA